MKAVRGRIMSAVLIGAAGLAAQAAHASPSYGIFLESDTAVDVQPQVSSTYDGQLAQNSVSEQSSGCSAIYPYCATASASASADFASGSIGAAAVATADDQFVFGGVANASAGLFDTLYFDVPGAPSGTVTDIGVTFMVHGTGFGYFGSSLETSEGDAVGFSIGPGSPLLPLDGTYTYSGELPLIGEDPTATLELGIMLSCSGKCAADFADTSGVSLELPAGVAFTSASGLLLTQPLAEVREPDALALFGGAVAGFVVLSRRALMGGPRPQA